MKRQLILKEPVSGSASHNDYVGKEKKKMLTSQVTK